MVHAKVTENAWGIIHGRLEKYTLLFYKQACSRESIMHSTTYKNVMALSPDSCMKKENGGGLQACKIDCEH